MDDPSQLTAFQVALTRAFFALPASDGFLIAGGTALAAHALTTRPTQDLDFFTGEPGTVIPALQALEAFATTRGWTVERAHVSDSFCRLRVHGPEVVDVDLALDARPGLPPTMTVLGPSYAAEEVAGRKVAALFGRAAARDLCDVFELAKRFPTTTLLEQAERVDAGFDRAVLVDMIRGRLANVDDADLPTPDPAAVRAFYAQWIIDLTLLDRPTPARSAAAEQLAATAQPPAGPYTRPPTTPPL